MDFWDAQGLRPGRKCQFAEIFDIHGKVENDKLVANCGSKVWFGILAVIVALEVTYGFGHFFLQHFKKIRIRSNGEIWSNGYLSLSRRPGHHPKKVCAKAGNRTSARMNFGTRTSAQELRHKFPKI